MGDLFGKLSELFTSDWGFLSVFFVLATIVASTITHLLGPIGRPLGQSILAASALTFALGSYRYTVKSTIREAVGEVPPLKMNSWEVRVRVESIRWRPDILHELSRRPWLRPQTTLKFVVYNCADDDRRPINPNEFLERGDIQTDDIDASEIRCSLGRGYKTVDDGRYGGIIVYRSGINIPYFSVNPDVIQSTATGFLHYCANEIDDQSTSEPD